MNIQLIKLLPLIFISGFSALVYQFVWIREMRLLFGISTIATSIVLAIFMGGIGFGAIVLGKRIENSKNPLKLYAFFEVIIAISFVVATRVK